MCMVRFGNGLDSFSLQVHGRTEPSAKDYWAANWLHCTAEVSVGTHHAKSEWQLRNEDLARFLRGLEDLDVRAGVALLDTGDGWVDVQIIRDEQRGIEARCQLASDAEIGELAEFRVSMDEASLPELIDQLLNVMHKFPIIGSPSSETMREGLE
jgi:hypothetical protein